MIIDGPWICQSRREIISGRRSREGWNSEELLKAWIEGKLCNVALHDKEKAHWRLNKVALGLQIHIAVRPNQPRISASLTSHKIITCREASSDSGQIPLEAITKHYKRRLETCHLRIGRIWYPYDKVKKPRKGAETTANCFPTLSRRKLRAALGSWSLHSWLFDPVSITLRRFRSHSCKNEISFYDMHVKSLSPARTRPRKTAECKVHFCHPIKKQ